VRQFLRQSAGAEGWDVIEGEQDGKSAAANRRVPILDVLAPILDAHFKRSGRVADALVVGRTSPRRAANRRPGRRSTSRSRPSNGRVASTASACPIRKTCSTR
jgi:hypothetical protein